MKYYFYIAFYSKGLIKCFNTKRKPQPINKRGDGKLLEVKKYVVVIK